MRPDPSALVVKRSPSLGNTIESWLRGIPQRCTSSLLVHAWLGDCTTVVVGVMVVYTGRLATWPSRIFNDDGVDEHHGTSRSRGRSCQVRHFLEDPVGDPADRVLGDVSSVDLIHMRRPITGRQALAVREMTISTPGSRAGVSSPAEFEAPVPVTRHFDVHWTNMGQHLLRSGALRELPVFLPAGSCRS